MSRIQSKFSLRCLLAAAVGVRLLLANNGARADVVGYLRLHVLNAADGKPLAGARVVISDTAGVRPSWTLTTDTRGEALSVPLENRDWQLVRITLPTEGSKARNAPADQSGADQANARRARRPAEGGTLIDLSSFAPSQRRIRIIADTTTEATLLVDVAHSRLAHVRGTGKEVFGNQVGTITRRDQAFIQTLPVTPGNPQSLNRVLQTAPRASGRAARH